MTPCILYLPVYLLYEASRSSCRTHYTALQPRRPLIATTVGISDHAQQHFELSSVANSYNSLQIHEVGFVARFCLLTSVVHLTTLTVTQTI